VTPATRLRVNEYIPQTATARQHAFLCDLVNQYREVFYGGAAGGGKSSALLIAALQYVDVPGYAALILRRSFADLSLPGAIMDRANDWLRGTGAVWNDNKKTYTFPSGATLTFGYLEHEADKYRYQGAEFQFIGFDELTQFSETQYRYLFSRLRRVATIDAPLRMRAASNPGGVGHEWVKRRFIDEGRAAGRVFIPAKLDDNPHLQTDEYLQSLALLDHVTRMQLLRGDWDVRDKGPLFDRSWFEVVDTAPAGLRTVRYWDLAATDPKTAADPDYTAGVLLGVTPGHVYYVLDVKRVRGTPQVVQALVAQTAAIDGRFTPIRMEQEPGSSGKTVIDHYTRNVLSGWAFAGVRSTGPKEARAAPVSSQAEAGNIKLVRGPWVGAYLDELEAFPIAGVHDDQVDATSGALTDLMPVSRVGRPVAAAPRPVVDAVRDQYRRFGVT